MEKALLWCLRPEYHPEGLIEDEDELARHVLRASDDTDTPRSLDRLQYNYSVQNQGYQKIYSPVGRYQAELLLRSAHRAIDDARKDLQKAWEVIDYSYYKLWSGGIFHNHSGKNIMHRTSSSFHSHHL